MAVCRKRSEEPASGERRIAYHYRALKMSQRWFDQETWQRFQRVHTLTAYKTACASVTLWILLWCSSHVWLNIRILSRKMIFRRNGRKTSFIIMVNVAGALFIQTPAFALDVSYGSIYCCLVDVFITNSDLIVASCEVQFRKVVASLYNVEQVLDVWQAHFVFDGHFIQLSPVTHETKASILLLYEEHRCPIWWLARLDKSF